LTTLKHDNGRSLGQTGQIEQNNNPRLRSKEQSRGVKQRPDLNWSSVDKPLKATRTTMKAKPRLSKHKRTHFIEVGIGEGQALAAGVPAAVIHTGRVLVKMVARISREGQD